MTNKRNITYEELENAARMIASQIISINACREVPLARRTAIYGVPRGGIYAAVLVQAMLTREYAFITENITEADFIIDDIIESGATAARLRQANQIFLALFSRPSIHTMPGCVSAITAPEGEWLVFPWEKHEREDGESISTTIRNRLQAYEHPFVANDNLSMMLVDAEIDMLQSEVEEKCQALLETLLIDTASDHNTHDTAKRMAKMFIRETFAGRYLPPPKMTVFPNAKNLDELYTTGPITVRSTCSHHFAPIFGKCWIGVIPGDTLIGLSKFNRIVDWIMSRPQIQEEAAVMLADFLEGIIKPKGLAIVIKATHTCMTQRGTKEHMDAEMVTSVMRGAMRDKPEARAEFLALIAPSK